MCTLHQPGIIAANVGRRYVNAYIIIEQLQGLFFFICSVSKTAWQPLQWSVQGYWLHSKKGYTAKKLEKLLLAKYLKKLVTT